MRQALAKNLRLGVWTPCKEIFLLEKTDGNARRDSTSSPCSLYGGCLAGSFSQQAVKTQAWRITLDARQTRVNDIAHARHGQGSFGKIGGQDNPLCARFGKHFSLHGFGQAGVKREYFLMRKTAA